MWTKSQILQFCSRRDVTTIASSVATGSLSAVVAYGYAKRVLESKYEKILEEEIASVKHEYSRVYKTGEFSTPEGAVRAMGRDPEKGVEGADVYLPETGVPVSPEKLQELLDKAKAETEAEEEVVQNNVFDSPQVVDLNYVAEKALRQPGRPYIISADEFGEEEEFDQVEVTYFVNDDMLVDERDEVIPNSDEVIGDENLLRFGHGSDDPDVVFVRNELLSLVFSVVRTEDSYGQVVHGVEIDEAHLEHSEKMPRKGRFDDE